MADRTSRTAAQAAAGFERGVGLLADLVEEIWSQGDDVWIETSDRGHGVKQNTAAVRTCLDALARDPEAVDGFAAALTTFIAPTGNSSWADDVSYFRDLTYEKCHGGCGGAP